MIERLAPLAGGGNRDLQVLADAILADVVVERPRAEAGLVLRVLVAARAGDQSLRVVVPGSVGGCAVISEGWLHSGPHHFASSRSACFSVRSKSPSGEALTADSTAFSARGR